MAPLCHRNLLRGSAPGFAGQRSESETFPPGITLPGPNPAPAPAPEPALSQGHTPAPAPPSADEPFRQFMRTCIEKVRDQVPGPAELREEASDMPLMARNPDLYYGNSHMECYYFCQQYEDHFKTAGAKGHRRIPFAASLLKEKIFFRWQQHKSRIERDRSTPPTRHEFKAFLRKSLEECTAFVDNIWSKIRKDSQYQQEEVQD